VHGLDSLPVTNTAPDSAALACQRQSAFGRRRCRADKQAPDWQTCWQHLDADGKLAELSQPSPESDPRIPAAGRTGDNVRFVAMATQLHFGRASNRLHMTDGRLRMTECPTIPSRRSLRCSSFRSARSET
jgi:hypothetical protein